MRYGFYLPTRGETATPEALEALVTRGEALGFASVMIADRLVFPLEIKSRYPYTVSGVFPGQGDALDDHQDDHEHRRAAERGRIGRDRDEPRRADGLARIVRVAQVAEQSFVELAQIAL